LLLPLDVVSWCLKNKYVYSSSGDIVPLFLIHPEVEARLSRGDFSLRKMDVFRGIPGRYDMILSFNLLQRNYFPRERIARGVENLTAALNEQGFLIMGSDDGYSVRQKREGKLVVIRQEGRF
jgi:chemotaxis methyl-accepting protein methylase